MKFLIPLLIFATSSEGYPRVPSWATEQWLDVPLDHFNLLDARTWRMRYFVNTEFFQDDSPIFVEIGGEWAANGYTLTKGQMYLLAKDYDGLLVASEHRYYGKSLPFSNDFSVENLRYLQVEQALEDLIYLIKHIKATTDGAEKSKVIVHGCSYAGMLATWSRSRFPHIVDIAYASSAPLGVGLNYPEYYEVVNDVYANVSASCIETLKNGFKETEKLLRTEHGRELVKNALRIWNCGDIDNMPAAKILRTMMKIVNVQNDPVEYEQYGCIILSLTSLGLEAYQRLANFVVFKSHTAGGCKVAEKTEAEKRESRAWKYQTCTELGFFQTLDSQDSRNPFGIDFTVDESVKKCVNNFGEGVTEELLRTGIERVHRRYGGKHPKVSKLVTAHGVNDPWKALGISDDTNKEAPVIILPGSHCVDDSEREDDPPEVINGRETIRKVISMDRSNKPREMKLFEDNSIIVIAK